MTAVSVNFYLRDSVSSNCGSSVGIQVFENPSLTHVVNVQVNRGDCASSGTDHIVDGYQVHTTYGGVQTNQVYSDMSFATPTATSNSYCMQSPYDCTVGVWTGLINGIYNNSASFLAQTGTEAEMNCTSLSCPTPSYFGWWDFYPANQMQCASTDTLAAGDSMQAEVENGYYWGGSSNDYRTFLFEDTGTGWVCSSGSTAAPSGTAITDYAETLVERIEVGGSSSALATFNSGSGLTLSGNDECYYLSSLQNPLQCGSFYNMIQTQITMQNSCSGTSTDNITPTSSIDSSSDFSETFSTACGT